MLSLLGRSNFFPHLACSSFLVLILLPFSELFKSLLRRGEFGEEQTCTQHSKIEIWFVGYGFWFLMLWNGIFFCIISKTLITYWVVAVLWLEVFQALMIVRLSWRREEGKEGGGEGEKKKGGKGRERKRGKQKKNERQTDRKTDRQTYRQIGRKEQKERGREKKRNRERKKQDRANSLSLSLLHHIHVKPESFNIY